MPGRVSEVVHTTRGRGASPDPHTEALILIQNRQDCPVEATDILALEACLEERMATQAQETHTATQHQVDYPGQGRDQHTQAILTLIRVATTATLRVEDCQETPIIMRIEEDTRLSTIITTTVLLNKSDTSQRTGLPPSATPCTAALRLLTFINTRTRAANTVHCSLD